MKPIILITAGIENTARGLIQTYCYKTYSEAIARAGGIPLIVGDDSDLEALADLADGLYITGGVDVDAHMYNGDPAMCGSVDSWRDHLEEGLIHLFVERKKPVFGICRGMQIINIVLGGTLYEDIYERTGRQHPFRVAHKVITKPGSSLHHWYGDSFLVNSFHHQVVHKLGAGLEATAWTEENLIEAFAHESLPILGVQWHPERMTGPSPYTAVGPDMHHLFEDFCSLCNKEKQR